MALFKRAARPRGVRPELPAAVPGSSIYPGSGQWGEVSLPLPSTSTVLGLPAASRAVNMIANAVSLMTPLRAWTSDGYLADTAPTICTRPNATYGCYDFFDMLVRMVVMRGNFLGIKADFQAGYPQQIVPVPTGFWLAYYDGNGYLRYDVSGREYSRDEVVHVRINALPNQPMGVGVVTQFRRSLGMALDQQNLAADTYRTGSVPAGVITLDQPEVDNDQANETQAQWVAARQGSRAPAVLPNTMKFEAIQWSPEDLQFLQARQFTVAEIAHMFNLDPTDLGAALTGDNMTYANIESRQVQRTVDSYAPFMRRIEEEWSDCMPGGNTAKMDPDNLLRTDSKTRAEVDQTQIGSETRSTSELRKRDGLRPLPKPTAAEENTPPPTPHVVPDTTELEQAPIKVKA